MKDKLRKLVEDYTVSNEAGQELYDELCILFDVSKCLPTEKESLEIRNELAKEHIDRLSKQPLYFILRAGIEKGMDAIINRIKANDC